MQQIKDFLNKTVYGGVTVGHAVLVGLSALILYPFIKEQLNK